MIAYFTTEFVRCIHNIYTMAPYFFTFFLFFTQIFSFLSKLFKEKGLCVYLNRYLHCIYISSISFSPELQTQMSTRHLQMDFGKESSVCYIQNRVLVQSTPNLVHPRGFPSRYITLIQLFRSKCKNPLRLLSFIYSVSQFLLFLFSKPYILNLTTPYNLYCRHLHPGCHHLIS